MILRKITTTGLWCGLLLMLTLAACQSKKVALDEKQFTALLIDMHIADGTMFVHSGWSGDRMQRNYGYYNDVFKNYGIDQAQFDSCMYYYSAKTALFSKMYDIVIDSLNKRLTVQNVIMNELRANDSINLYPYPDTIVFDTACRVKIVEMDSIRPGLYKFSTTIKLDSLDKSKNNRIESYFLSEDNKDTLRVRNVEIMWDTLRHVYNWSQYADSTHNRLVIKFIESDKGKPLKYRRGQAWGTTLFRVYTSPKSANRMMQNIERERESKSKIKAIDERKMRFKLPEIQMER